MKIKKIYNDFRNKLHSNINNNDKSLFTQQSEDCYLIEELWINELLKCFNKNSNNLPKSSPTFINEFQKIINSINNSKKLKIVNKKIIESLSNQNDLKDLSIIQYYGGNNKIIIEYKNKNENKALLLLNPLDDNLMKYKAFILSISNNTKLYLFKDLLYEIDNSKISSQPKYKNFVIPFEQHLNSTPKSSIRKIKTFQTLNNENFLTSKKETIINEDKDSFNRDILRILIYTFYYEKNISENGLKIFNENQKFYLIDKDWFDKYLEIL